ncbi:serine/threonine-protein kinase [Hyalangium gracile]|uniref:serine/threonine-protein kinase n=1 Tax=Hyalangium gracile TaxID=394092 RepID=UPI001CCDEE52|nr:serine/threonine-protein kinase [Hyalangium gracile]
MHCLDEATFMELLLGGLPPARAAEVDAHLDSCPACRRMMAQALDAQASSQLKDAATATTVPSPSRATGTEDTPLARGTTVGRYLVLERLGVGGMGMVYSAYDPELNRQVALKLLRTGALGLDAEDGRAHLLREAQAMARVSHPNVVPVYDVGTYGEQVFLTMELVEARTLRLWLRDAPRSWREVRDAFVQAGRGLAAAHAVGIVHGDIKPENLLVGQDGRVRVTDFGLARTTMPGKPGEELPQVAGGTPAYMAPEQLADQRHADGRSDQFSFCAALFEGLYGERPFNGSTVTELAQEMRAGRVRPVPRGTPVPGWLHRVVLQGLDADPARRHASIEALLSALLEDPAVRRRLWVRGGIGLTVLLGAVGVTHALNVRQARACADAAGRALAGVWDAPRQQAVEAAFLGTGRPFATAAWAQVRRSLDAYTSAWVTTRTATCEATRTGGEQPEELLAGRMRCLDGRLAEMAALTQVLSQADADVMGRALRAVESLPSPASCVGAAAPPESGGAQVDGLRAELVRARALGAAGRYKEGLALAQPVADKARQAGDPAAMAESLLVLAELLEQAGDYRSAEKTLFDALASAEASRNDDVAARGWTLAVRLSGERLEQFALATRWRERAEAAITRLGGDPVLRARLHGNVGRVLFAQGRYGEAAEQHAQALVLLERTLGLESLELADVLLELSQARAAQRHGAEALDLAERALALRQRALGPDHPDTGMALADLAEVRSYRNEYMEAEQRSTQALEVLERALGPEHPGLVSALNTLAMARLSLQQKPETVLPLLERALRIMESSGSPEISDTAVLVNNIGTTLGRAGRWAEAERHLTDALARMERQLGPEHPTLVVVLFGLASVQRQLGRPTEALPHLERAAAIQNAQPEDVRGMWVQSMMELGRLYLELQRPKDAVVPLTQLVDGRPNFRVSPLAGAAARFFLADALWKSGGDKQKAVQLAKEVHSMVNPRNPTAIRLLKDVDAWLAQHAK